MICHENPSNSINSPLRLYRCLCLTLPLLVCAGCNQNQPAPAGSTFGAPAGTFGAAPSYFTDVQRRASQQARLASEQQRQLAYMRDLQRRTNAELQALKRQQSNTLTAGEQRDDSQTQDLAARAREAMGRYDELGRQAQTLDRTNRDLYADLAQVRQRLQLAEDQNHLLRQRLKETSDRLANAMQATDDVEQKYQSLVTSSRRQSGASITANNSYRRNLTAVTVEGLDVRQDGDLVRIVIASDRLFESDGVTIRSDARTIIDQVSDVILRHYPRQVVGVEAHADNSATTGRGWRSPHQLTAAQAMAVFEAVSERQRLIRNQMFVLGHGANYPVASNATVAGQASNRRVEVVIYPETAGQR